MIILVFLVLLSILPPPGQPDHVPGAQGQEPGLQVCPCLGRPRGGKLYTVYKNKLINGMPTINLIKYYKTRPGDLVMPDPFGHFLG